MELSEAAENSIHVLCKNSSFLCAYHADRICTHNLELNSRYADQIVPEIAASHYVQSVPLLGDQVSNHTEGSSLRRYDSGNAIRSLLASFHNDGLCSVIRL